MSCCCGQSVSLHFFTLRLKPTAKNSSGHISGHVQPPNCSPFWTVSMDLYCLELKAVPARCRTVFSSTHRPVDSTASRDTTGNRKVIFFYRRQHFSPKKPTGGRRLLASYSLHSLELLLGWIIDRVAHWCGKKQLLRGLFFPHLLLPQAFLNSCIFYAAGSEEVLRTQCLQQDQRRVIC